MMKDRANDTILVRRGEPGDAEDIWEIEKASWIENYASDELGIAKETISNHMQGEGGELNKVKIDRWSERLRPADERCIFVAVLDGRLVGYIYLSVKDGEYYLSIDDGERYLSSLHLSLSCKRRGIGTKLLEASLSWCGDDDVYVYLVTHNQEALSFYEKHGFVEVERGYAVFEEPSYGMRMPNILMVRHGTQLQ